MSELKHEFTWKLRARPARVFSALTDANELKQWFAEYAEVEPHIGGAFRFWGKHSYGTPTKAHATQRITKFAPSQAIAFTWRIHNADGEVSFAIEADPENGEASVVKGTHVFAEAPAIDRAKELIDDLWRFNWGNLSAHLAGGQSKLLVDYNDPSPKVALSTFIDAPPTAVWRALMDPDKIQKWFGVAADVEEGVGGSWQLRMEIERNGKKERAPKMRFLEYVENERLVLSWADWRGDPNVPDQRVVWALTPEGGGTRLNLVHDGFVRAADISDYPFGWGYFLPRIGAVAKDEAIEPAPTEMC